MVLTSPYEFDGLLLRGPGGYPDFGAKETKELHIIEGATHIDMYDRAQLVTPAVAKLTDFFGRHLADARGSK
jgi:hypothetical protein